MRKSKEKLKCIVLDIVVRKKKKKKIPCSQKTVSYRIKKKTNPNAANQNHKTSRLCECQKWLGTFVLFVLFFDGGGMGIITAGVPPIKETL